MNNCRVDALVYQLRYSSNLTLYFYLNGQTVRTLPYYQKVLSMFTVVIILNHSFVLAFQKTTRVNNRDTSGIGVDLLNHQNTLSFFSSHLNIRIFFNLSIFLFLQSSLSLFQLVICFSSCKYNIFLLQNLVINFYFQHR